MTTLMTSSLSQAKEPCALFPISKLSVQAGSSITWNGEKTALLEKNGLSIGASLSLNALTNLKMETKGLSSVGKVRLISFIPSVDTPVCDSEIRQISETHLLKPEIEKLAISMDLPYAQRRFSSTYQLENITFLSDYLSGKNAKTLGLQIQRNGLFARAIVVTDRTGVIRYFQIVPEITDMPDLQKAYDFANALAGEPSSQ